MFRTARVTFHTTRHGGQTVTDEFRVWFVQELWTDSQDDEVRHAVHEAGERDFEIIEWSFVD